MSRLHCPGSNLSSPVATFDAASVTKAGRGCVSHPSGRGPVEQAHGISQHQICFTRDTRSRWRSATVVSRRRVAIVGSSSKHYADPSNAGYGRLQGGGVEKLICFICLACRDAYISPGLSEEYVARCCTCGRGACRKHGEWEVGKFHCIPCHGNRDQLIEHQRHTGNTVCEQSISAAAAAT